MCIAVSSSGSTFSFRKPSFSPLNIASILCGGAFFATSFQSNHASNFSPSWLSESPSFLFTFFEISILSLSKRERSLCRTHWYSLIHSAIISRAPPRASSILVTSSFVETYLCATSSTLLTVSDIIIFANGSSPLFRAITARVFLLGLKGK